MSKLSMLQKEKKKFFLFNKYFYDRNFLKKEIKKNYFSNKSFNNFLNIQKLPRNSSPTRLRNRCCLTGRPRGVFRRFGLSRNVIRNLAFKGYIPGLFKSSW